MRLKRFKEVLGQISLWFAVLALGCCFVTFGIENFGTVDRVHFDWMSYSHRALIICEPIAVIAGFLSVQTKRGRLALTAVAATVLVVWVAYLFHPSDKWRKEDVNFHLRAAHSK